MDTLVPEPEMTRHASKDEVLDAFRTSSRIAPIDNGEELFYAYMIDNQAIAIHETIDAIRAFFARMKDAIESIASTNAALGPDILLM